MHSQSLHTIFVKCISSVIFVTQNKRSLLPRAPPSHMFTKQLVKGKICNLCFVCTQGIYQHYMNSTMMLPKRTGCPGLPLSQAMYTILMWNLLTSLVIHFLMQTHSVTTYYWFEIILILLFCVFFFQFQLWTQFGLTGCWSKWWR